MVQSTWDLDTLQRLSIRLNGRPGHPFRMLTSFNRYNILFRNQLSDFLDQFHYSLQIDLIERQSVSRGQKHYVLIVLTGLNKVTML